MAQRRRTTAWRCASAAVLRALPAAVVALACGCAPSSPQPVPEPRSEAAATTPDAPIPARDASPAAAADAWFEDKTAAAGIDFRHVSGNTAEKPFPAANGSGLAALDYDLDGRVDLYFVTGTTFPIDPNRTDHVNRLYRNLGAWRFEDVSEPARVRLAGFNAGVAVGDFDADGFPDVYITRVGANVLLHNEGDGTFTRVESQARVDDPRWGASAAWFDYDEDGLLDLYVCNYAKWTWETNPYCGDRARGLRMHCGPATQPPEAHILYHNEGDGTFRDAGKEAGVMKRLGRGQGVLAADLDGDGHIDLFVTNDANPNFLFLNDGRGKFRDVTDTCGAAYDVQGKTVAGMGVDAADLRATGRLDLFVGTFRAESIVLYENLGDGLFQDVAAPWGLTPDSLPHVKWGIQFGDFDLDGRPDLIIANGHVDNNLKDFGQDAPYAQPPLAYRNTDGKRFKLLGAAAGAYFTQTHVGRGMVSADLDDDGDLDLAIVHQDGPPALLCNTAIPRLPHAASISLRLIGTRSNRNAVGAALTCRSKLGVLTQQIKGGSSYNSAPDLRQIFAVPAGAADVVVEIRWPLGNSSKIGPLQAGRRYVVVEPVVPTQSPNLIPLEVAP